MTTAIPLPCMPISPHDLTLNTITSAPSRMRHRPIVHDTCSNNEACCCWCCQGADTEPVNVRTNPHSPNEIDTPKRQFLIAPRVGRGGSNGSPHQWSPHEAASSQHGHIQSQRPISDSSKPSLLFLVGNPRIIGQRSTGLLPQARIGRRGGLLPQPRIGRRSYADNLVDDNEGDRDLTETGQPEVASVALSDSSIYSALESMIEG